MDGKAHGQSGSVNREVPKTGGETNKRRYETRRNTKEYEPSKILSLNAQGLIKTDTKWKVDMLKEYVHKNNIFLMNLTETWLKKEIQDEKIPNFTTFRADRKGGKSRGGGAAIYLRDGLEAQVLAEEYVDSCEMIAIFIEKINVINIVIYRPPDTKATTFIPMLKMVEKILIDMKKPEPTVIITGDFNFPFIEWTRNEMNICSYKIKSDCYEKTEEKKKQFYEMMEIMDKFSLVQAIQEPTRKENTLDLVFTNDISIFTQVVVTIGVLRYGIPMRCGYRYEYTIIMRSECD